MSNVAQAHELLTTNRKALVINLDETRYGTFAEIGAGQEVARHFFQAGGASGTIAKTMSAYDMAFSDSIYGKCKRYVSRERLETMLDHEFQLLRERLWEHRGDHTRFFVFADTVAARSYHGENECHGWLGVRFQTQPLGDVHEILVHVRMWDRENLLQQQAVGILGVNLIYGAFFMHGDPPALVRSLCDNLSAERIEVDYVRCTGAAFGDVDHQHIALQLVEEGMTNAVYFSDGGAVELPAEAFYKKAILMQRGSFRPVTRVNPDIMTCAAARFSQEPSVTGKTVMPIYELSTPKSTQDGQLDRDDLLGRVATLNAIGGHVLVSNYEQYFRLTAYFRRYTSEMVGAVMGVRAFGRFLDESYYENLDGGILEALGRLFKSNVRLYVYPRQEATADGKVVLTDAANLPVPDKARHLRDHLLHNGLVESLTGNDPALVGIFARDVLRAIQEGKPGWERMVPEAAAQVIRERKLFVREAE